MDVIVFLLNEIAMPSKINPTDTPSIASDIVSKTYGNNHILIVCSMEGSTGGPMYGGVRSRTLVNDIAFNKKPKSKTREPIATNIMPRFTVTN